jgi:thiamine pyrophosphokinase
MLFEEESGLKLLIMSNGEYGSLEWYREKKGLFERIICADGAAEHALQIGVLPDLVVGDMDSISEEVKAALEEQGVNFLLFPQEKDYYTDTQLAFRLVAEEGPHEVTVWGGTGTRLDHTLSNLSSAVSLLREGAAVTFESPWLSIYLVSDSLELNGQPGEIVSVLVLGDRAAGVSLHGFKYLLDNVVLRGDWQYAVSNVLIRPQARVQVAAGVLAVFHYRELP